MRRLFFSLLFFFSSVFAFAWGFFAHKHINRLAVFTLPSEMFGFYKSNIEYLSQHAVDPDKRRYSDAEEACRHYLDADHYERCAPIDSVPFNWKDAVAKFTEDTLKAYGIVPWHASLMVHRLSDAFKEKNKKKVLRLSAELGHYVGDAHVPLHATENYNGQLTGQKGIHGFWESRLPELFHKNYDLFTGKARYIEHVQLALWTAVNGSFAAKDSVLDFERELSKKFPDDRKYSFEQKGRKNVRNYSPEYSEAYHDMLNGMVERRMKASIALVGSLWYTAWVNAGQPDLSQLEEEKPMTKEEQKAAEEEEKKLKEEKVKARPEE